jgi:hypothetical protein
MTDQQYAALTAEIKAIFDTQMAKAKAMLDSFGVDPILQPDDPDADIVISG